MGQYRRWRFQFVLNWCFFHHSHPDCVLVFRHLKSSTGTAHSSAQGIEYDELSLLCDSSIQGDARQLTSAFIIYVRPMNMQFYVTNEHHKKKAIVSYAMISSASHPHAQRETNRKTDKRSDKLMAALIRAEGKHVNPVLY